MAAVSTIIAGAGLAVTAGSAIQKKKQQEEAIEQQKDASRRQNAIARQQLAVQKEANAVSSAQEQVNSRVSRQRAARQERVRRAQLLSSSSMSGMAGSSGLIGAQSAMGSNFGQAVAQQRGQTNTAFALSNFNQQQADLNTQWNQAGFSYQQAGNQFNMASAAHQNRMSIFGAAQGLANSIWGE